jgi:hypothetical protein
VKYILCLFIIYIVRVKYMYNENIKLLYGGLKPKRKEFAEKYYLEGIDYDEK